MRLAEFLALLEGVRPSGQQWEAKCPAHDDKTPSLKIRQGNETIIIHCFAGCRVKEVIDAMGLQLSDLWLEKSTRSDRLVVKIRIEWDALLKELDILHLAISDRKQSKIGGQTDADRVRERTAVSRIKYLLTELYK